MKYIFDQFGRRRLFTDVLAVQSLELLKKKSQSNPWPVIEKCIDIWKEKNPSRWESNLFDIEEVRETRKDKKYGSSKDKVSGGIIRYTLDIPQPILFMIRCIYNSEELPMNKQFLNEFARRFPVFKVAEKL